MTVIKSKFLLQGKFAFLGVDTVRIAHISKPRWFRWLSFAQKNDGTREFSTSAPRIALSNYRVLITGGVVGNLLKLDVFRTNPLDPDSFPNRIAALWQRLLNMVSGRLWGLNGTRPRFNESADRKNLVYRFPRG